MDRVEMSWMVARETTTLLITLSLTFLTLTITFTKELVKRIPEGSTAWLAASWVAHLLSLIGGVLTLATMAGMLARATEDLTIYEPEIRIPSGGQMLLFLIGMILMVIYGAMALRKPRPGASTYHPE